jgi:hypothetical protein
MTKDARMLTGIAWNVVVEYAVLMAATIAMLGARVLEMPEGRLEWMASELAELLMPFIAGTYVNLTIWWQKELNINIMKAAIVANALSAMSATTIYKPS